MPEMDKVRFGKCCEAMTYLNKAAYALQALGYNGQPLIDATLQLVAAEIKNEETKGPPFQGLHFPGHLIFDKGKK